MSSPLFVSRFGRGAPILCLHGIEAHGLEQQVADVLPLLGELGPETVLLGHSRSG